MNRAEFTKLVNGFRKRRQESKQFNEVMDFYRESRHSSGACGALDYEQALSGEKNGSSYVVGQIRMSGSDFLCDVEILARRLLGPLQLEFFKKVYVNGLGTLSQSTPEAYKVLDVQVRGVMSRAFAEHGLYPIPMYMHPVRTA